LGEEKDLGLGEVLGPVDVEEGIDQSSVHLDLRKVDLDGALLLRPSANLSYPLL
jgi:hypothetical protein